MAAPAWTEVHAVKPTTSCTVMASRLPVTGFRATRRFRRDAKQVRRQLAEAAGLVGYALDAKGRTFLTVSAWTDPTALAKFNRAEPHKAAAARNRSALDRPRFVTWECTAADLPIPWPEVRRRLDGPD